MNVDMQKPRFRALLVFLNNAHTRGYTLFTMMEDKKLRFFTTYKNVLFGPSLWYASDVKNSANCLVGTSFSYVPCSTACLHPWYPQCSSFKKSWSCLEMVKVQSIVFTKNFDWEKKEKTKGYFFFKIPISISDFEIIW